MHQVAAVKQLTEDWLTRSDAPDAKKNQGVTQDRPRGAPRGSSADTNCKGYAADQENESVHHNRLVGPSGESSPNLQSAPKVVGLSANSHSALGPPIRANTESQENQSGPGTSEADSPEASRYEYEYYEEESDEEREELYARLAEPFERPKQIAAVQPIEQAKLAKHPSRKLPPLEIPGDPYSQKEHSKQAQEPKLTPVAVS